MIERGYEGLCEGRGEVCQGGRTTRWLKVKRKEWTARGGPLATDDQRGVVARAEDEMNEERDTDALLWHPWLRIERSIRAVLADRLTRGAAEVVDRVLMARIRASEA